MLEKLKKAIGIAEKSRGGREISQILYNEQSSRLVVEFADGSTRTHLGVIEGHIVGLRIAEDKLDFYESQIETWSPALETAGVATVDAAAGRPPQEMPRQTAAPDRREKAQS